MFSSNFLPYTFMLLMTCSTGAVSVTAINDTSSQGASSTTVPVTTTINHTASDTSAPVPTASKLPSEVNNTIISGSSSTVIAVTANATAESGHSSSNQSASTVAGTSGSFSSVTLATTPAPLPATAEEITTAIRSGTNASTEVTSFTSATNAPTVSGVSIVMPSTKSMEKSTTTGSTPETTSGPDLNQTIVSIKSGATKQGISPGIGALLGIIAAVVFVGVLVLMYKYQRKFMYAFRFQRLQEVPMDDLEDFNEPDAVYAEHTVPIRLRV